MGVASGICFAGRRLRLGGKRLLRKYLSMLTGAGVALFN